MAYTFKHGDRPLEDFTIQRAVGRGGFGEVYYAVSDGGREVALKYLRDNPQIELRGTAHCMNLKSPHLVTIFDVKKSTDGDYFIVMEYVSGPSLRDLLVAEANGLGPQKSAFFIREIAKGLAYLHDRGIVHRDLKPGNIFYEEGYVKIGDYGLSKFISISRHSGQTASVGTVHYMAPEVGSGNYHLGIDIYALGVILYEMLMGRVPFEGGSMGEVLMKHLTAQPEVASLPQPFGKIIRKALEKDPKDRYQNAYEMVDDLLAVDDVQTSLAGFNPASLSAAARRGAEDIGRSPAPSPNPPPRGFAPSPAPAPIPPRRPAAAAFDMDARRLPPKLEKRIARTGERVSAKLRKLAARHGRPAHARPVQRNARIMAPRPAQSPSIGARETIQRGVLAMIMAVGLGIGVGFLCNAVDKTHRFRMEYMFAAPMCIAVIAGGLALGCRAVASFGKAGYHPPWLQRTVLTGAAAPLIFVGMIPLIDYRETLGLQTALALIIGTALVRWSKRIVRGTEGSLSTSWAFTAALPAFVCTMILTDGRPEFGFFAGGTLAGASLMVQALAWLFPLDRWLNGQAVGASASGSRGLQSSVVPSSTPIGEAETLPYGQAVGADAAPRPPVDDSWRGRRHVEQMNYWGGHFRYPASEVMPDGRRRRWGITRFVAGLFAFALFTGMLALILYASLSGNIGLNWNYDAKAGVYMKSFSYNAWSEELVGYVAGATACFGMMLVALRKTTRFRRGGFYRDTVRPVFQAACMVAMSATITLVATDGVRGDDRIAAIVGIVTSSLALLLLTILRGRKYPAQLPTRPSDQGFIRHAEEAANATEYTPGPARTGESSAG